MYKHRTYVEKSDDFVKMTEFLTQLNSMRIYDWSVGRMYAWKYGRWSERSQDDSQFEKQAELFFDEFDHLCGIIITENFGCSYYLLAEKNQDIFQSMLDYLKQVKISAAEYAIILCENDAIQIDTLIKNNFAYECDVDVTYCYSKSGIVLPKIVLPDSYILSDQKNFSDLTAVEKQRFISFNPNSEYDAIIDKAYKYSRNNPLLVSELNIVLLDDHNSPVSSCMGYWDKKNNLMEIEVVATRPGYENRGFAKIVISECIRKGLGLGVVGFSISAYAEKTKRLYSSFGKYTAVQKVRYKK